MRVLGEMGSQRGAHIAPLALMCLCSLGARCGAEEGTGIRRALPGPGRGDDPTVPRMEGLC